MCIESKKKRGKSGVLLLRVCREIIFVLDFFGKVIYLVDFL